jgi:hypothetical protein
MARTRLEPTKGLRREASTRVATCAAIWCEAECGVGPSHPRTRPGAVPTKQRIQVQRPCPPGSLEFVSLGARVMWRNPYPHASMGVVTNTGHYRRGRSGSAAHLAACHTHQPRLAAFALGSGDLSGARVRHGGLEAWPRGTSVDAELPPNCWRGIVIWAGQERPGTDHGPEHEGPGRSPTPPPEGGPPRSMGRWPRCERRVRVHGSRPQPPVRKGRSGS